MIKARQEDTTRYGEKITFFAENLSHLKVVVVLLIVVADGIWCYFSGSSHLVNTVAEIWKGSQFKFN